MKDSDLTGANVTWAAGGSVSTVSFEGNGIETRSNVRGRRGGGIRGDVQGFSRASRRNLLRRLAAIDRASFEASGGRALFVTLTYPHAWPDDPEACKWHLKAFRKRLQRRYGPFAAFWRLGVQGRGAWHFHLLLFVGPSFGAVGDARRFVARAWYEICGEVSEGHLRAGTQVQELRSWKKATSYAERYLAKREVFPEGVTTGRVWGVWDESLLPVRWQTAEVSARDAHKVRRAYGRLAGRKGAGPSHRLTVFVDHETVARLLAFLGYRPEGSEAPRDRLNSSKREFGAPRAATPIPSREEKRLMIHNGDRNNGRAAHPDLDEDRRRELDGWIDEVTRKPWFVALEGLAGDAGFWVGTEDELKAELRARVDGDTGPSEGFPSDVGELTAPPSRVVEYALRKARLDVLHHRLLERDQRELYDAPGWGRRAPILVTRGRAGRKFTPEAAAHVIGRHRDPIAGLFVLFAYHDRVFTKNRREWTGTTRELAKRLTIQYWNAVMFHTDWRIEEVERLLRLEHLEDFSRFCGRVRTAARILEEVGVKVSSEKATGRRRATGQEYAYTLWTVEAPLRLPCGPRTPYLP